MCFFEKTCYFHYFVVVKCHIWHMLSHGSCVNVKIICDKLMVLLKISVQNYPGSATCDQSLSNSFEGCLSHRLYVTRTLQFPLHTRVRHSTHRRYVTRTFQFPLHIRVRHLTVGCVDMGHFRPKVSFFFLNSRV